MLIAIGKKTRLNFAEINEFSISDLLAYARAYSGAKDDVPRDATQDDIDAFFG